MEDAQKLENMSKSSVHIRLDEKFSSSQHLLPIRDFLFDNMGDCSVYFHVGVNKIPYIVKSEAQLKVAYSEKLIKDLEEYPHVLEVWSE